MEQRQSLKALELEYLELDENHCRVLGTFSRPGLEIGHYRCKLMSAGTSAFGKGPRTQSGPDQS
jgi:hypothetical protein